MQHGRRSEVLKSKKQEISGDALASRLSRMSFISFKAETVSNVVVLHGEIEVVCLPTTVKRAGDLLVLSPVVG